ncbi:NmrA/HSCARG family protein [Aspergillus brunneoviolaceus CBS 621.78]|uniref:NmrA family protein n=1 Tax=Aspergillus brunneoviolaceus CBS 621.78 TaxID=1450534 RepID=A0ACD1GPM4_9EURO|nr:NmrA family protein [Aspergillus brunneoviolaceus CBS 621.78]RAH51238.1 NmrA family protein [Aspergillus brunneoviolaceus CBS 621.78]
MTIQQNKIITIFGGTGNQGGSVARSLLAHKDGRFHVRVITRDPSSDRAKAIAADGASLVQADGFNREQMAAALAGSWGVFINTNSDDEALKSLDGPSDYDLGAAVIDAAEEAGVPHVVYSSGPSITNATKGRIHLEGFETKYHVEQYARAKSFKTFTPVLCASFMECFFYEPFSDAFGGFPWTPNPKTGDIVFSTPPYGGRGDMPWVSVEDDVGDIIHGIFLNPSEYDRVLVQVTSQQITMPDIAASYAKATGIPARYEEMPSWTSIQPNGTRCRDETRLIFWMMNACGGRWFAEHESDNTASIKLKNAALEARGQEGGLITFEEWFKKAHALRTESA